MVSVCLLDTRVSQSRCHSGYKVCLAQETVIIRWGLRFQGKGHFLGDISQPIVKYTVEYLVSGQ